MGTTKVLVVTQPGQAEVVAYYGWFMAQINIEDAPVRLRRGAGRYLQPVALLARLGVSTAHEGRGIGVGLFQDVLARTLALGDEIGCRGLLVHAEGSKAQDFYYHLVPEFESSPTDGSHLLLSMRSIRKTLVGLE